MQVRERQDIDQWGKHNSYVTKIVSKYSGILFRLMVH